MLIIDELPAAQWRGMTHRDATATLLSNGWNLCGIGQWAVVLRSPSGRKAVRVCPFDPAYAVYIELCRSRLDDPFLPRIDAHVELDGGAHLTVMEHLRPAEPKSIAQIMALWNDGGDDRLTALRSAVDALAASAADRVPWFDGVDMNAGNVMRTQDDRTVLVDVFCMDGAALFGALLSDPASVAAVIPVDDRRHMTEIAFISTHSTVDEIAELRAAVRRIAGHS